MRSAIASSRDATQAAARDEDAGEWEDDDGDERVDGTAAGDIPAMTHVAIFVDHLDVLLLCFVGFDTNTTVVSRRFLPGAFLGTTPRLVVVARLDDGSNDVFVRDGGASVA